MPNKRLWLGKKTFDIVIYAAISGCFNIEYCAAIDNQMGISCCESGSVAMLTCTCTSLQLYGSILAYVHVVVIGNTRRYDEDLIAWYREEVLLCAGIYRPTKALVGDLSIVYGLNMWACICDQREREKSRNHHELPCFAVDMIHRCVHVALEFDAESYFGFFSFRIEG